MRQTIYFIEWIEHEELRTPVLMILIITERTVTLSAAGFVDLNLDLAVRVCKIT